MTPWDDGPLRRVAGVTGGVAALALVAAVAVPAIGWMRGGDLGPLLPVAFLLAVGGIALLSTRAGALRSRDEVRPDGSHDDDVVS